MNSLASLTKKKILDKIELYPTRGTIIVPKKDRGKKYKADIDKLSDFLIEGGYQFGLVEDDTETHVHYELIRGRKNA